MGEGVDLGFLSNILNGIAVKIDIKAVILPPAVLSVINLSLNVGISLTTNITGMQYTIQTKGA